MNEISGGILEWKVSQPIEGPLKSPMFRFHGCECYMELLLEINRYEIYLRGNTQPLKFPEPFKISSCIEIEGKPIFFHQESYICATYIRNFEISSIKEKLNSSDMLKLIFIFHGDIGSTLRLKGKLLEKFSQDTARLLDEALFYDVEIKCGEQHIKAHKNILCARSQVFSKMFQNDTLERQSGKVEIEEMDSDIFRLFLRYLYSGQPPELTSENAVDLYEAGDRYEVLELREYCAKFLIESLTPENFSEMLLLADAHNDEYFKEAIIAYIGNKNTLMDDLWKVFSNSKPKLVIEVLNILYKQQIKE